MITKHKEFVVELTTFRNEDTHCLFSIRNFAQIAFCCYFDIATNNTTTKTRQMFDGLGLDD